MNDLPANNLPFYDPTAVPAIPKRTYSAAERWLLLAALCAGILFDQLFVAHRDAMPGTRLDWAGWGIFWLCMTGIFCVLNWNRLRGNRLALAVGALCASLGVWFLLNDVYVNWEYAGLTFIVLPVSLMGFARFVWGGFALKEAGAFALAWVTGFFATPFSAIGRCFGAIGSLVRPNERGRTVKLAIGCALSLGVLVWLFSAMAQADLVFEYYVNLLIGGLRADRLVVHAAWIGIVALLMYSFFWNSRYAKRRELPALNLNIDRTVATMVLVTILAAYALFSVVQFTFLFGRAGLPPGLTYSQYAVSGFWQVVMMAIFNLAVFGVVLRYITPAPRFTILACGLLLATGVMLISATVRLSMYIGAYHLTWLRLISAWFLIYLAAVLILCAVRLFVKRLPLIAVSALLLLGWYAALGYANPAGIIAYFAR